MDLGPELFKLLNARQKVGNQIPVIYGAQGLSPNEIAVIEFTWLPRAGDFRIFFKISKTPAESSFHGQTQ